MFTRGMPAGIQWISEDWCNKHIPQVMDGNLYVVLVMSREDGKRDCGPGSCKLCEIGRIMLELD